MKVLISNDCCLAKDPELPPLALQLAKTVAYFPLSTNASSTTNLAPSYGSFVPQRPLSAVNSSFHLNYLDPYS